MDAPDVPVVRPLGELTHATAEAFEAQLAPLIEGDAPGVVVALDGVVAITSAGLSLLVHAGRRLGERNAQLVLAGGPRAVVKLIRLVGLDNVIPHFPTTAAAAKWVLDRGGARNA